MQNVPPLGGFRRSILIASVLFFVCPVLDSAFAAKLRVNDPEVARQLIRGGARLIADYGAFQYVETVNSPSALSLAAAPGATENRDSENVILLNAVHLDTTTAAIASRLAVTAFTGRRTHLIQFAGPVKPEWRKWLESTGVTIVDYVPNNAYLVYGDNDSFTRLQQQAAANSVVQWEGAYLDSYKIHPAVSALASKAGALPELFSIQLIADDSANAETSRLIAQLAAEPPRQSRALKYVNVIARVPPGAVAQIAARPDVISIQHYVMPERFDERQDQIVAGNLIGGLPSGPGYLAWLTSKGFSQEQFTASGFAVDVTDSGIDNGTTTPGHFGLYVSGDTNLESRVIYNRVEGTPNSGSTLMGCDGHGTLNSHIIGGYNDLSGFPHADSAGYRYGLGVCPFVKLGSSVIFDPSTFTSPNYANLISEAYHDGARISSDSWGGDTAGAYTPDSQMYDALVRDAQPDGSTFAAAGNQEMVIVFAAGNAGSGTQTVGSPGTGKNVLTVGAAENVRSHSIANGGNSSTGNDGCGEGDSLANNSNDMATFSSRGPCADGRKKPDIVAPGTHVTGGVAQNMNPGALGSAIDCFDGTGVCRLSGGGSVGNANNFFPLGQQFYTTSSGTSHSTPCVAGGAALVRQYFINEGINAPSPAMTKAFLMNSARYMNGSGANDTLPSNNQGMGHMNLGTAFDGTRRRVRDQLTNDTFTATGQTRVFTGAVGDPTKPFRVTIAWTDAPGSTTGNAYNNNLDLTVTVGGHTYLGNVFSGANSIVGGAADVRDNVESVFLPAGVTGPFTVTVTAANIVSDGVPNNADPLDQDFALVIYNDGTVSAAGATLVAESCGGGNGAVDPGETVTASFALMNNTVADYTNLVATLLATGGVLSPSAPQTFSLLPAGGTASQDFTFRADGHCGDILTATLQLQDGTTNLGNVFYRFTLGSNGCCLDPTSVDLAVSAVAPVSVPIGSNIVYTISATNSGPSDATSVNVLQTLPTGTVFVSAISSQGTCAESGGTVVCSLGTVTNGGAATITVEATVLTSATLISTVQIAGDQLDYALANNAVTNAANVILPTLSITGGSVTEGDAGETNVLFTVTLSSPTAVTQQVAFATADHGAMAGVDYAVTNGTLTFYPGETNQTISVTVFGDTLYETNEGFYMNLSSPVNASLLNAQAVGTIVNDDAAPVLTLLGGSVVEGNVGTTNLAFTVTLSALAGAPVSAGFVTSNGTAVAGSDYVSKSGVIFLPPGATSTNINVTVKGDLAIEPDEMFYVGLVSVTNAALATNRATGTIINDDGLPGHVDHFVWSVIASPEFANQPFAVTITALDYFGSPVTNYSGPALLSAFFNGSSQLLREDFETGLGAFTVDNNVGLGAGLWHWSDGRGSDAGHSPTRSIYYGTGETAVGGGSYNTGASEGVLISPSVTLSAAPATLTLHYLMQTEGNTNYDRALIEISTNDGASFTTLTGTTQPASALSTNTAGAWQTATVDLSAYAGAPVRVRFHFNSVDNIANAFEGWYVDDVTVTGFQPPRPLTPGITETFTNGVWSGTVAMAQAGTNMFLRVSDGDGHFGDSSGFSIEVENDLILWTSAAPDILPPAGTWTNQITVSNTGPAAATAVFVTNTIPESAVFVSGISSQGDVSTSSNQMIFDLGSIASGATATMTLVLSSSSVGTISNVAVVVRGEVDGDYANNAAISTALVQNPTVSVNDISVIEGESGFTPAVFTIQLWPAALAPVMVDFSTANGSAIAGEDYIATNGTLLFAPGQTNQTVTVQVVGDVTPEGNETFSLVCGNPVPSSIVAASGVCTILSDDAPSYFTEWFDSAAHTNDLAFNSFMFVPAGGANFYSICRKPVAAFPADPSGGLTVSLTDDSYAQVTMNGTNSIAIYGRRTNVFFISSNGYLTLGAGDAAYLESYANHFNLPRISALFDDLNPEAGGTISARQFSDRVAVTYQDIREFGSTSPNSFQIEMFFDGRIRLTFLQISALDGLAGLSAGNGVPSDFVASDLTAFDSCGLPVLTVSASGGIAQLGWPSFAADYRVERTTNLAPPVVWEPVTNPATTLSNQYQLLAPMSGSQFFRLVYP